MLKIVNLSVDIENKNILHDFNLNINKGEIHAIMGPNGIGKSTICKTIMGDENYTITSGDIIFDAESIKDMPVNERSQKGIYLVSQNPIEVPGVSNAEMLRTAISARTGKNVPIFEFNKKLENICDELKVSRSFIHRGINEGMSGGERKKCEVMHLWMLEPKLIILDELDSGLDVDSLNVVCDSLNKYIKTHDAAVLIITHHKLLIDKLNVKHIHIIKDGTIVKSGGKELADLIENEGYSNIPSTNRVSDEEKNE